MQIWLPVQLLLPACADAPQSREVDNLQEAVEGLGITYPVAQDDERRTWSAYRPRRSPR